MKRQCQRVRRLARRHWGAALLAACGALALAALARPPPAPPTPPLTSDAEFPHTSAAHLAHLLADVTAHTLPLPGSWSLEEEAGNYTSWSYTVAYECGPRCAGRLYVRAHDEHAGGGGGGGAAGGRGAGAPRHGLQAAAHHVRVRHVLCTKLFLLPFLQFCDETETVSVVTSAGAGARLQEWSRARCGGLAALAGRCGGEPGLRARAARRLLRLRERAAAA